MGLVYPCCSKNSAVFKLVAMQKLCLFCQAYLFIILNQSPSTHIKRMLSLNIGYVNTMESRVGI